MNGQAIKVSVIIPIYNCERYIGQCIESVLNQTIKELEIICVDDGSTDKSASVVRFYAKKDKRIALLQQKNKGAGAARNIGLKLATGRYVCFLDADDYYVDADALAKMITKCEQKGVKACGSFSIKDEKGVTSELSFWGERKKLLDTNEQYDYTDYQFDYGYVTFIYERVFLIQNGLLFPEYRRFEDPPFLVRTLHTAKYFAMADTILYCYRIPNMTNRLTPFKIGDIAQGIIDNLNYANRNNLNILFENTMNRLEYEYCDAILHSLPENSAIILDKLFSINTIKQIHYLNNNILIRPVKMMLDAVEKKCGTYESELREQIEQSKNIIVYGTGKFSRALLLFLKRENLIHKVIYIMVSVADKEPYYLEKIPVISIQEANRISLKREKVLIAAGGLAQKEIVDILKQNGYENFELMDSIFLSKLDS